MKKNAVGTLFLAILATLGSIFLNGCALRPVAWQPAPKPTFTGATQLNEKLTNAQQISLKRWYGAEDIVFDKNGALYCGVHTGASDFADGCILKIDSLGGVDIFYDAKSWVAGLHIDKNGNLLALSHREGLIQISPDKKVTVLAAKDEQGKPFLIPNGLAVAEDGNIYFSNTSENEAYTIKYGRKIILELNPLGGLYCYNPETKSVKTLLKGTYFGNGVVVSQDQTHLLLVETSKYRVLRYWLKGEKQGKTEVFMDNLHGFPNGISLRPDGTYWLGFSTKRNDALDGIHPKTGMKKFVYGLPSFLQPKPEKFGMVMNISKDGQIIETLFDTKGSVLQEAGAVKEYNGFLYIGGDVMPHIGKYKLVNK